MENRADTYRTNLSGEAAYESFVPLPPIPAIELDSEMVALLMKAIRRLPFWTRS